MTSHRLSPTSDRTTGVLLALVLAVGLIARLPGLGRNLTGDEAMSLFDARGADVTRQVIPNGPEITDDLLEPRHGWRATLTSIGHDERTPPLYFVALRLWTDVFGTRDETLRFLSVMFGVGTIAAVFYLGRNLFEPAVGLTAAGLVAILPLHVQYSQEVRAPALAVLLVTLGSWLFWKAFRAAGDVKEKQYWLQYAVLMTASLYTHYFAAGILLAHVLFAGLQPSSRKALLKRLAFVGIGVALLLIPWLMSPYFRDQLAIEQRYTGSFSAGFMARRLLPSLGYLTAGYIPGAAFSWSQIALLLTLYATSVIGLLGISRFKQSPMLFVAALWVWPAVFMLGMGALFKDFTPLAGPPRFLPLLVPGFCLLLGATLVYTRRRLAPLMIVPMALVFATQFQLKWPYVNRGPAPDSSMTPFGQVSVVVERMTGRISPDDLLVFDDETLVHIWAVYQRSRGRQLLMSKDWYYGKPMDWESRWREVARQNPSLYLVRLAGQPPGDVVGRLVKTYRLAGASRIERLEIQHYTAIEADGELPSGKITVRTSTPEN